MGASSAASPVGAIEQTTVREESPVSWAGLVAEQEAYVEEKRGKHLVFVGDGRENSGEILAKPYTHRWTRGYVQRQYARMNDFVEGAYDEYDDPWIVIFPALTASTITSTGRYRPPLDHFERLKQSWARGVRCELNHVMDADRKRDRWPAREWEYLQVWGPTTDAGYTEGGYAHLHPVVVCEGRVGAERFESVLRKHVEKCEWAQPEAHDISEIDIRPLDELSNPAACLFKYLSKSWDPDEAKPYQRRFDALLHETGYRRFQPSDGAQRWMQTDSAGAVEPWIFAGVGDRDDIEHLWEFDDAHEFRIAHETGVKAWLAKYDPFESVSFDASEHTFARGRCTRCGLSEPTLVAGRAPWDGPASECPGEPPPAA